MPDWNAVLPSFGMLDSQGLIEIVQGDTIEVFVQNNTGTENITIKDLNCLGISSGTGGGSTQTDLGPYAGCSVTNGSDLTIVPNIGISNSVHVNGTYLTTLEDGFTNASPTGRITYNGTETIRIKIDISVTATMQGVSTSTYKFMCGINGTHQFLSQQSGLFSQGVGATKNVQTCFFTQIIPGQIIDVMMYQESGIITAIIANDVKLHITKIA